MINPLKLGLVGTGFIATGLLGLAAARTDLRVTGVLTRRPPAVVRNVRAEILTRDADALVAEADLIVECSGSVRHATDVVAAAVAAGKPVVTMNSEFHVTVGSYFSGSGLVTEAEGDQAGSLAALSEEVRAMGFEPRIFGNTKGFLNLAPTREEMTYWAGKQGISVEQVTSFTDGTKVQIEQAFVANGLGGTILARGMAGPKVPTLADGVASLWAKAVELDVPCADYLVTPQWPGSIFIAATHPTADPAALRYFKMGNGPHYTIVRPYHLCHLEIFKTIDRVRRGGGVLLENGALPRVSVATVAKVDLPAGTRIARGIGSFQVRGEAVLIAEEPDHVPIGLLEDAVLRTSVQAGQTLTWADVDVPDSLALRAWHSILARLREAGAVGERAQVLV